MTPNSGRALEVFTQAFQLPVEEQSAFLDRVCAEDEGLRRKIEALLRSNERAGSFLEEPPTVSISEQREKLSVGEKPGNQVGRYTLVEQIGEGGCGIVFMAEQQEPIRRRVALKVIKPGMDSKGVIARFEGERQALALMDHPNIAHVFDAGAAQSGRPYFVMELVEGVKLTDYCDKRFLTMRARLELFTQICDAIQHAHQKGIIHRDIKPSNILVATGNDGKGLPKVIDFGIAKATTGQLLTDNTIFTAFEMLVGTPAYMSPEQATLSSAEIDTRTDIYSLGVLLYELLTGTTPFDTRELLKAGLDEIRRVIRDEEPVRPSTRLSTMLATDAETVSRLRGAGAPKLISEMRGDLDWIVMKALEKDRARRYATANGLAMDVQRYLCNEAVLARPPSTLYKARKLVARNKALSISMGVILLLVVAGLAVTTRFMIAQKQKWEHTQHENELYRLEGLGVTQWVLGARAEAESDFRRSFAIRDEYFGGKPPNAVIAALFIDLLEKQNKIDDAANFLIGEIPRLDPGSVPGYVDLYGKIGKDLAVKVRWKEATNLLSKFVELEPDNPDSYHTLAPLLAITGNVLGYRQLCPRIISRFHDTQDPSIADQMAKDCLILPDSGADLKAVGALANLAVARGTNYPSYPLFQCCKALAEYREGHFAAAIQWAEAAVKDPFPYSKAEGSSILAMAHFKMDQTNEARVALANCNQVIERKLPKLSSGDLGGDWRDWMIAHTLRDEAQRLIEPDSAPAVYLPTK
jgi:serine/threonine protein kinase